MHDTVSNSGIAPEGAAKGQVKSLCLMLDEDIVNGIDRLRNILGFPIETMIAESLRPFINTFLPVADLYQQGKLSIACVPDIQKAVESLVIKSDVAKAHFDKDVSKLEKQKKAQLRGK